MFEGNCAETYIEKFLIASIGGRAGDSCVCRHGSEDPQRMNGNFYLLSLS
jgi:hypothetical protein